MIATIQLKDRKTGKVKRLIETNVAGYSDAQRMIKELRKVTTAKISLISLREK